MTKMYISGETFRLKKFAKEMKITLKTSRLSLWQPQIQIFKELDVVLKYTSSFNITRHTWI